jgi:signal transduction histidine kinase/CheY-like chemotaxis protein
MDATAQHDAYMQERRRRLAAERALERVSGELRKAHDALVANADRLSRNYLSERERNLKLTDRQEEVLRQRKEAAEQADRSRRRLWHALETMRDGFAVFDPEGRLVAANSPYLRLFECEGSVGPGAQAMEVFTLAAEEGAFDIGEATPEEWARAHVARWAQEEIPPLVLHHYDGRTLRLQDRRALDGDIVSLAVDLSAEAEREAALTTARDEAEAMARAKADFLARMSHEIRTPMNGVMGLAELLLDRQADEEGELYARTIRESAEALLRIVNDTLDVSKLEAGGMELRADWFDLEAMLASCIRLMRPVARAGVALGLAYPLDAPVGFMGDAGRLQQIVVNLLGNALRFTEAGHVLIRLTHATTAEGTSLQLMVEDTGTGIPAAEQESVFEAFGQAASSKPDRAAEGTGLGLTISRGLAERMGGSLTLRSQPDAGSTFTLSITLPSEPAPAVRLPARVHVPDAGLDGLLVADRLRAVGIEVLAAPAMGAISLAFDASQPGERIGPLPSNAELLTALRLGVAPPDRGRPAPGGDGRPLLLMADDNATNRLLLDRMMRNGPYRIHIVNDGLEAVEAYAEDRPAAVVLDISMPRMDGFEAAAAMLGSDPDCAPIIALTAHVGDEMGARLGAAGFAAHLTKPLRKEVLLDTLAEVLGDAAPQPSATS